MLKSPLVLQEVLQAFYSTDEIPTQKTVVIILVQRRDET